MVTAHEGCCLPPHIKPFISAEPWDKGLKRKSMMVDVSWSSLNAICSRLLSYNNFLQSLRPRCCQGGRTGCSQHPYGSVSPPLCSPTGHLEFWSISTLFCEKKDTVVCPSLLSHSQSVLFLTQTMISEVYKSDVSWSCLEAVVSISDEIETP